MYTLMNWDFFLASKKKFVGEGGRRTFTDRFFEGFEGGGKKKT